MKRFTLIVRFTEIFSAIFLLCGMFFIIQESGCAEKKADNKESDCCDKGPVGIKALDSFDLLPRIRYGVNTVEFSSYDREGYNDSGFSGAEEFLYVDDEGATVLVDVIGPGCIYNMFFAWPNHSMVPEELEMTLLENFGQVQVFLDDGQAPVVDLSIDEIFSKQHSPFLNPFVFSPDESSLGAVSYLPIPFRNSCKVRLTGGPQPFSFYQIWFHRYRDNEGVATFTGKEDLSGTRSLRDDIGQDPKDISENEKTEGTVTLTPPGSSGADGQKITILELTDGGRIQSIHLQPSVSKSLAFGILKELWIEMEWDGMKAVEAPLNLLFALGNRGMDPEEPPYEPVIREAPVRSIPVGEDEGEGLYCYFPMPFAQTAKISLQYRASDDFDKTRSPVELVYEIAYRKLLSGENPGRSEGYFRTQYRQVKKSDFDSSIPLGEDYILLDARGTGHYVGVVIMAEDTDSGSLEGDERAYIDGSLTPQIHGIATETYFQGSWYFNSMNEPFSLPLYGAPVLIGREGEPSAPLTSGSFDFTMYRFHLTDLIPFHDSIRFGIQHGGVNEIPINYSSLAFYYALDESSLIITDEVDVGDLGSETDHHFAIDGNGGEVSTLTAYYEGDLDGSSGRAFTPDPEESSESVWDDGRDLISTHSFVATIDPGNGGIKLRRRFDQGDARQKARVLVDGHEAGIWYYAGANAYKKWREDDFEIPQGLTKNKKRITVTIEPLSKSWNEYHYWIFSYLVL